MNKIMILYIMAVVLGSVEPDIIQINGVRGFKFIISTEKDKVQIVFRENLNEFLKNMDYAIVNGGYFEVNGSPSGYLESGGKIMSPVSDKKVMSGMLLCVDGSNLQILQNSDIPEGVNDWVIQTGPIIVRATSSPGINSNVDVANRTFGMLDSDGFSLIVTEKIGLKDLCDWLVQKRCVHAINLDGGPSSYAEWNGGKFPVNGPIKNVPYYIGIRRK